MRLSGFDWDGGNREKCSKHGVSLAKIEELFAAGNVAVRPDLAHSQTETRFLAIGRVSGDRWIFVAFTWRLLPSGHFVRPISARYMHDKEVERYETDNP